MIGGPGIGLPYPTSPYPAQPAIPNVSSAVWTNSLYMPGATMWLIPPGWWAVKCGSHSAVYYRDPVTLTLVLFCALGGECTVNSDGVNFYLFNSSGTPAQIATVTGAGSGYVAASTTVTSGASGSTWTALVDGTLTSITVGNDKLGNAGGTNFTNVPLVIVQAPPAPGIQATALATISGGAVTAVTIENAGAGYTSAPGVFLIPDPLDPTLGSITIPALTSALAAATGAITGVLQTYPGISESSVTLTINGVGTSATATAAVVAAGADTNLVQWLGSGG